MKKLYMCTTICSSGKDCGLTILFQFYGSRAGLSESNLFWVGQYDPPKTFILEEKLIQYQYNLMQFLSNLSKIIPSQTTASIIL